MNNNVLVKSNADEIQITSASSLIEAVYVIDLYTPNTSNYILAEKQAINRNEVSLKVTENFKLLQIKIVLQDGTIINKKILR